MPIVYEKGRVPSDVFVRLEVDFMVHMEKKTITNAGEETLTLDPGYPMDDNVPELEAGTADVDGFLYAGVSIPAGESLEVTVVARGPGAINVDMLPDEDYEGTPFTKSTLAARALLLGLVPRDEPDNQAELPI